MDLHITLERVDGTPTEGAVRDFDELGPAAQREVLALEGTREARGDAAEVDFGGCDYVRYTDYYRVERRSARGA